jgi:hypothetical protein
MLVIAAVLAKVGGMSFKSRHTRHRAKSSVSPRATRLSVKKTARQRPKAKKSAR